jgi:hypothetical protein
VADDVCSAEVWQQLKVEKVRAGYMTAHRRSQLFFSVLPPQPDVLQKLATLVMSNDSSA